MKTRFTLSLLVLFVLTSCIKDFYGHPDDKDGVLTSENYVYSDDIRSEFLEQEIALLEEEIKELGALVESGQATEAQELRFETAQKDLTATITLTEEISDYRELVYKGKPLPPPPCPKPRNCNDWLNFNYVTIPSGLEQFGLLIYDQDQNVIGQTEGNPETLGGTDGLLDYVVLIFNEAEYQGEILVKGFGTSENGEDFSYFIESSID